MKMQDFKNKTEAELKTLLAEKHEALRVFRFGMSGGKIKNIKEGMNAKKDIARIMTEMNAR